MSTTDLALTEAQRAAIVAAYEALTDRMVGVVGCAMFAPDAMRKRDLPGIVEAKDDAERALNVLLEDAGVIR